jgi:hypothetical protein
MRAISRAAKQGTPHFIVVAVEEVSLSAKAFHDLTAGCIDTGLPAGRRYFGQSDKPLIETARVHHACGSCSVKPAVTRVMKSVATTEK